MSNAIDPRAVEAALRGSNPDREAPYYQQEWDRMEAALSAAQPFIADADDYKEALRDLVALHHEAWTLNGGGPGIAERWKKAWEIAMDLVVP